jgi:lipopolysaccharide/colanic/teichoic acid biosynthesis glycosyltransferase
LRQPARTSRGARRRLLRRADASVKRTFDVLASTVMLLLLSPLMVGLGFAIVLESPGPVLYRCRRTGRGGHVFDMLKFRKMLPDAAGLPLTVSGDERLTTVGKVLTKLKLDELPQLWNVLIGQMSLVGPRPEDPLFVELRNGDYAPILGVRPGVTGLSQLAFARESDVIDNERPIDDYLDRLFPAKIHLDRLYVAQTTVWFDLKILFWTAVAIILRREVAVNRATGRLTHRRRPSRPVEPGAPALAPAPAPEMAAAAAFANELVP